MKKRKSTIKKYLNYKFANIKYKFIQSMNIFVDVSEMNYDNQKLLPYAILSSAMAIFVTIIFFQIKKMETGRGIIIVAAIAFVELVIWTIYLMLVVIFYRKCRTKQERKNYVPSTKIVKGTKVLLFPMEMIVFLLKILGLDIFSEYISGLILGMVFSILSSLGITYYLSSRIFELSDATKSMYLVAILIVILFYFIMYMASLFYFYCIRYSDYDYDFKAKDKFFKIMWNRVRQIFHIANIFLIFINYVQEGGQGLTKYFVAGFALLFSVDTVIHNWNKE